MLPAWRVLGEVGLDHLLEDDRLGGARLGEVGGPLAPTLFNWIDAPLACSLMLSKGDLGAAAQTHLAAAVAEAKAIEIRAHAHLADFERETDSASHFVHADRRIVRLLLV